MKISYAQLVVAVVCIAGGVAADDIYPETENLDDYINNAAEGDTIHLTAGAYYTSSAPTVKSGVTITGNGADNSTTTISPKNNNNRTLNVAGGEVANLTIVGANGWEDTDATKRITQGAAVHMTGGTVRNCIIKDGRGYYANAKSGGNMYIDGADALVVDCTIQDGYAGSRGGNIHIENGTVRNCTIKGGRATAWGGNVYIKGANAVVEGCTILDGTTVNATASNSWGGNVMVETSGTVRNSTIGGGYASVGGGNVFLYNGGVLENCTIENGWIGRDANVSGATYGGGNVYIYTKGTITGGEISGGSVVRGEGGNVRMQGGGSVEGCRIECNGTTIFGSGGCIWMSNGTIANVELVGGTQTGYDGGCLYMTGGTATEVTCSGGRAGRNGGNVFVSGGSITGIYVSQGVAATAGGNVYINANVPVKKGWIRGGTSKQQGGNVYMMNGTLQDLDIADGVCTGNVGDGDGGGNIFFQDGLISRCRITGGKLTGTTSNRGGGINCVYTTGSNRVIEDCLIANNENAGVFVNREIDYYNCSFIGNTPSAINSWSSSTRDFKNCVIFGNKTANGDVAQWTGNRFNIVNVATDDTSLASMPGYIAIDESAFADYDAGDWHPASGASALVDAGAADNRSDASALDLEGNIRIVNSVDIGCYEYQPKEFGVSFSRTAMTSEHEGAEVTFSAVALGDYDADAGITYVWDFGDGTAALETADAVVTHVYSTLGVYSVKLTATVADGTTPPAEQLQDGLVTIYGSTIWVNAAGSATAPYDTAEKGLRTISSALELPCEGYEIAVAPGVYQVTSPVVVGAGVAIRGKGTSPEDVVVRNVTSAHVNHVESRVFEIDNASALVENITMENGQTYNRHGANLRLGAGTVANCVIRNGLATATSGDAAGGGVALTGPGVLTHCVVRDNTVTGASSADNYRGGAIFVGNGAKPVKILNTLVAYNTWNNPADATKKYRGSAGITFGGSNENGLVENVSIVANTVNGATLDGERTAAVSTSQAWTIVFRNVVMAGNYETLRDECTSINPNEHITVTHCATDDAKPYNANNYCSGVDGMFKNFANGDFTPKTSGVLYNTGGTPTEVAEFDLFGNPRLAYGKYDIGCIESQAAPGFCLIIR